MNVREYLTKQEVLNIVFKRDTMYVRADDVSPTGHVIPYKLENVSEYVVDEGMLHIKFRPFYSDNSIVPAERIGRFPMAAITKVFVNKQITLE